MQGNLAITPVGFLPFVFLQVGQSKFGDRDAGCVQAMSNQLAAGA